MEKRQSNSVKVVFAWAIVFVMLVPAFAQRDPGVGGRIQNTGVGLQQQGIPIPHPPLISARKGTFANAKQPRGADIKAPLVRLYPSETCLAYDTPTLSIANRPAP